MTSRSTPGTIDERIDALEQQLGELRRSAGNARTPTPRQRGWRMRRALVTLTVAAALVALPASIIASHDFSDVLDGNTFHTQISDLADSGITAGCNPGLYCPNSNVTRGQMAGFLHRGLGRVGWDGHFGTTTTGLANTADYETVLVKAGDVSGGEGYILVIASASMTTNSATPCPCTIRVRGVVDNVEGDIDGYDVIEDSGGPFAAETWRFGNASVTEVFKVSTGATYTVELRVTVTRTASSTVGLETALTAIYVPFDGLGTNGALAATTVKAPLAGDPAK